ncbi:MAG: YdcH family protein [Steroidobacteraceae bacterium]
MLKRGHIADLERRHQALKEQIANALTRTSSDDLMIFDLKSRLLHLRDEIARELERLRPKAITRGIYS